LRKAGGGCLIEDAAFCRQPDGAGRALQHTKAQIRFKLPDLMTDRGWRDEQLGCRALETGAPSYRFKGTQRSQRWKSVAGHDEFISSKAEDYEFESSDQAKYVELLMMT
jgi:hypothetical protein